MKFNRFALVSLAVLGCWGAALAESGWARYRVYARTPADVQRICDSTLTLYSDNVDIPETDVAVGPKEIVKLWELGLPYRFIKELDDPYNYAARNPHDGLDYRTEYFRYDEIIAQYEAWRAANPRVVTRTQIGSTHNGRAVWAYRIYNQVLTDFEYPRKSIVILGGTHAREWISPAVTMHIAKSIIDDVQNPTSPIFAKMADKCALYVVPSMNPDGYEWCWTNFRLWRKNRRNNGGGVYGVDLNRNYITGWGGQGSSSNPSSEIYRGPAAWSEPENQAVRDFMMGLKGQIVGAIDFHSYAQKILYPWSYTTTIHPQAAFLTSVGNAIKNAIQPSYGTVYLVGQGSIALYVASGTSKDWWSQQFGSASYTIELRDTGDFGFELPPNQITPSQNETYDGFKAYVNALLP